MVTVASRMPLIEGVGDEVLVFVGIVVLVMCVLLAWFSTSVTDQPLLRATAVFVIERHRPSQRPTEGGDVASTQNQTQTSNSQERKTNSALTAARPSEETSSELQSNPGTSVLNVPPEDVVAVAYAATELVSSEGSSSNVGEPLNEDDCGSDPLCTVRRRKLGGKESETDQASSDNSNINATEDDGEILPEDSQPQRVEEITVEAGIVNEATISEDGTIRIRLKFLNDTQRLVEGKLEEPLGDFKRRYFGEELENDKLVRLIFNGQLLRSDQETLQFYGLFDNCVLHCQISNNVAPPPAPQSESYAELDLSRFMLPLFGVILGVIWYCRVQYRQFFNATSTFALLGITGLFLVSLVALFIPRRETRQHVTWTTAAAAGTVQVRH